jgi:hypothetical protein
MKKKIAMKKPTGKKVAIAAKPVGGGAPKK